MLCSPQLGPSHYRGSANRCAALSRSGVDLLIIPSWKSLERSSFTPNPPLSRHFYFTEGEEPLTFSNHVTRMSRRGNIERDAFPSDHAGSLVPLSHYLPYDPLRVKAKTTPEESTFTDTPNRTFLRGFLEVHPACEDVLRKRSCCIL